MSHTPFQYAEYADKYAESVNDMQNMQNNMQENMARWQYHDGNMAALLWKYAEFTHPFPHAEYAK